MLIMLNRLLKDDIINNPWVIFTYNTDDNFMTLDENIDYCCEYGNTLGLRVKKNNRTNDDSYYTDAEYFENIQKIGEDLNELEMLLREGRVVVMPSRGLGQGSCLLRVKAPKTYQYLHNRLVKLFRHYKPHNIQTTTQIKAFDTTASKVVPLEPNTKNFANARSLLLGIMRENVEEVNQAKLDSVLRKIYKVLAETGEYEF